jgi:site-specific recombinase XerD
VIEAVPAPILTVCDTLPYRWRKCQADWLIALERRSGSPNTRRAYARDVADFFACHPGLLHWEVTPSHAEQWAQQLRGRGLKAATVNRRMAALSSLYRYAATEAVYVDAGGQRAPLWRDPNPFASRTLRAKQTRAAASYPSAAQVTALLSQINPRTVTGLRNLAILAGMFATTRRVSEWLNLRTDDLHCEGDAVWFEYRYKGGDMRRQALPADIWRIVAAYLQAAGRWPLRPGEAVFQPESDAGQRLGRGTASDGAARGSLSASYVAKLIRRYGKAAGIPPAKLHAHALRHAGARWRKDHGADVWQLKDTLGHASLATTQLYTESVLSAPEDPFANTIGEILPLQLRFLLKQ